LQAETYKNIEYLSVKRNSRKAIIMFHGYGANMQDLYGLAQYMGKDYDWYFPNGVFSISLGFMMEGRAWFNIDMVELEKAMQSGVPRKFSDKSSPEFDDSQKQVLEYVEHIRKDYDDIVIGGFSQGAMLTSHIAGIVKPKGMILFSATLIDKENLLKKLDQIGPTPFFQSHGKQDPVLEYSQAMDLFELLKLYKCEGEMLSFNGAHEIPMEVIQRADTYLKNL
jgi:phospholipase/carboxylesterase